MDTLEKIVPAPLVVTIGKEQIHLYPIKTKELPAMLKAVKPIAAQIQTGDIMGAFFANADCLIEAVSVGARKPRPWVDTLDLDDLVRLAGSVLEVNGPFFVQAVLPGIAAALNRVTDLIGQASSAPSLEQDTASEMS